MTFTKADVLADIHAGHISIDQHDYITVPDRIPVGDQEAYRLAVVDALTGALAMRPAPDGRTGPKTLLLTTVGEHVHRRGNPDRYRSAKAYEFLDGKVTGKLVWLNDARRRREGRHPDEQVFIDAEQVFEDVPAAKNSSGKQRNQKR